MCCCYYYCCCYCCCCKGYVNLTAIICYYIVLEQYSFNPNDVFSAVTTEEYLLFLMYTLEYRALVIEQMSHEAELKYIELHPDIDSRVDGYGVVLLNYCIRDLQGMCVCLLIS